MNKIEYVSVHGGHSGQFCLHAKDTLEDIICKYIEWGFKWVGITEHVPPVSNVMRYPDEVDAGLEASFLLNRFRHYIEECEALQLKYRSSIKIFKAFEIETYKGCSSFVKRLVNTCKPDYIVGSVHHVDDMGFDFSSKQYHETAAAVGGYDTLYCKYFDQQYEMLLDLAPAVVGHFDLVRLYDDHYRDRILKSDIWQRIMRNLNLIKEKDLIMDFNLRALLKGASEPYITGEILKQAKKLNIKVVPGDDSHGICDVGVNMDRGVAVLIKAGFSRNWPIPAVYKWT